MKIAHYPLALAFTMLSVSISHANTTPVVSITQQTSTTVLSAPGAITLEASAIDADGIAKVEFLLSTGAVLGTDTTHPYSFTWDNIASGNYWIRAKAYDTKGAWKLSSSVNVISNAAPTVAITSPAPGYSFPALPEVRLGDWGHLRRYYAEDGSEWALNHADVQVLVDAQDIDGSITKVEFYDNDVFVSSDLSAPFSKTLKDLPAGMHSISALAYDNRGRTSKTSVTVQSYEASIRINQLGYRIKDPKVFKTPKPVTAFEVRRISDNALVHSGSVNRSIWCDTAQETVASGTFTSVQAPGSYYIKAGDYRSVPFEIGENVYQDLLWDAARVIYLNRCGHAIDDHYMPRVACHLSIEPHICSGRDETTVLIPDARDVSGGWHNGADYRRSVMSAVQLISRMTAPLELFPGQFDTVPSMLKATEVPAGWPHLLAEAKWGIDWLLKIQDADGQMTMGIGPSTNEMPGGVLPHLDPVKHYRGMQHAWAAAKAGAVLAKVSRIIRPYDSLYADRCLSASKKAWDHLTINANGGSPESVYTYYNVVTWPDVLWLSVELYRTTGENVYHDKIKSLLAARIVDDWFPDDNVTEHSLRGTNLREALVSYLLMDPSNADPEIRANILASLEGKCSAAVELSNTSGHGLALHPDYLAEAQHPVGLALQEGWWLLMAYELTGKIGYRNTALAQFHYALGRNPLSMTYVTRVGDVPPVHFHHFIGYAMQKKPAGWLEKGATHSPTVRESFNNKYPGEILPAAEKTYFDFAHVDEPDIEAQGYLIAFAAYLQATRSPSYIPARAP